MKIKVFKNKNRYYFENEEYEVLHNSESLQDGFDFVENKVLEHEKYFQKHNLKTYQEKSSIQNYTTSLRQLFIKNMIRSFFNISSFIIILLLLFVIFFKIIQDNKPKGGRVFWKNIENEISKLANKKDMDAAKQQEILNNIKKIITKYKPFIDEVKKISE